MRLSLEELTANYPILLRHSLPVGRADDRVRDGSAAREPLID